MSDKLREVAKAALEWLKDEKLDNHTYIDDIQFDKDCDKLAEELEAALAEPAVKDSLIAQRPWVGLADEDFEKEKFMDFNFMAGASFAEAKLREKNS